MWGQVGALLTVGVVMLQQCHGTGSDQTRKALVDFSWDALSMITPPSITHLIRQPDRPTPRIMPCGTSRELMGEEEVLLESVNFSKKQFYPNSHLCEWHFNFPGRRAKLTCPNFQLTEFLCLDHLQVGDGNAVQNHYCGKKGPREVILVGKVTMRFSTSSFFPGIGFRCALALLADDGDENILDPLPQIKSPCVCGINKIATRVVNGTETQQGEVPWQAGLVRANESVPFCGGSLINDRYILTAAHCVVGRTPYNLEVILNADKTEVGKEGFHPDRYTVSAIIAHRNYTASLDYDAALIRLDSTVDLTKTPPICLPTAEDIANAYTAMPATVTGWGYTKEDGELSATLRKANVVVLSNEECRSKYSKVTDRMLCAASPGTDACQGDSGGPLFYAELKKHTQIGIVSWGIGCARPDRPGVYARVTEILKWIWRTAKDGSYCGLSGVEALNHTSFKEVTIS